MVGASGFSYEAAAEVAGCAVGTMKSRVARGRTHLEHILDGDPAHWEAAIFHKRNDGEDAQDEGVSHAR